MDLKLLRRRKNRKREETRRWQLPAIDWKGTGSIVLGVAAVGALAWLLATALDRPIQSVTVTGAFQRVSALDVERVVRARLKGGFVSADLEALRTGVEQLPWVDRARVQREWPHGLRVEVTEQVAAARWGDAGLLNTRGELFLPTARHVPPELPRLDGPDGTEWQVAQRYFSIQGRLLEAGLRISALRLDARGAWELDLANGVTVRLGRRQVDDRIERFIGVASQVVAPRVGDIAYVDMRYSNGFSIGWRTAAAAVRPAVDRDTAATRNNEDTDA
jgi:cell division protein FtsQ